MNDYARDVIHLGSCAVLRELAVAATREEAARRRLDGEVRLGRADDAREEDDGDLEARARREARRRELARVEDVGRLQERGVGCGWG